MANIFEELREQKQQVLAFAAKAKEYGWISAERENEIRKKIESDVLTIGVIGQMKCGKSTVLNSIVFGDDVLPAATTPMTAALSVITYGTDKKLKAEFYTTDEWAEQKMQASRPLSEVEGNTLEESKIKAAKELVEKSHQLGSSLNSLLGKIKEDTLDNLEEYVGADGKYVSITKSVTIYYPKDYLKGVEIVDTPGFNAPIVSREERTKKFLEKADVVLLMLYAGRPFDATDRDILFKNVRQCGIGKVLIGINKYDIPYHNGETEEVIKSYVKEEIAKACRECDDTRLVEILKDTEPIPLSAEMALLSELPMSKITSNEIYREAWQRHCDDFEISNQQQMIEKSHLANVMSAIRQIIEKEKTEILLRKPLSAIINAGSKKKVDIENAIALCKAEIDNYSQSDEEIEERAEKLSKAERRLNHKIDNLGDNIESELRNIVRKGKYNLEDDVDEACNKMTRIVDDMGRFQGRDDINHKLTDVIQNLIERKLKRDAESIGDNAKEVIRKAIEEFLLGNVSDIMLKYAPDFDVKDLLVGLNNNIVFSITNPDAFKYEGGEDYDFPWYLKLINGYGMLCDKLMLGIPGKLDNFLNHKENQNDLYKAISDLRSSDVTDCIDAIMNNKDAVLEKVKNGVITNMLKPLQDQLQEVVAHKNERQKKLTEASEKLKRLVSDKGVIEKQLSEFQQNSI